MENEDNGIDYSQPSACEQINGPMSPDDGEPAEDKPKRVKDRRVKDSPLTTYLWEQVPRQLLADAKAKTKREGTSIKAELIRLLRDWTYGVQP